MYYSPPPGNQRQLYKNNEWNKHESKEERKVELQLFGYSISNKSLLNLEDRTLISLSDKTSVRPVVFRSTMMRLFCFFLSIESERIITADEILQNVWDNNGLSSSNQRLWQVFNGLKEKIKSVNIPEDLITRTAAGGYSVKTQLITPLYFHPEIRISNKN